MPMRPPRNVDKYATTDVAAKGLESIARGLRRLPEGTLIRWHLDLRQWHPSWEHEKPNRASSKREAL